MLSCDSSCFDFGHVTRFTKWWPPESDIEKYTHGHIYETNPPIFIKFDAKCESLQPLSSEIKDNLFNPIPLRLYIIIRQFSDEKL